MVVFVSRCSTWIVAQVCDAWIVFELINDEESIQICDEIRGKWDAKGGGQKVHVNRTHRLYIGGRFSSVRVAVQKAKQWSGDENT
jgi:hypothetical protein